MYHCFNAFHVSITASRLFADAIFRATACFYFNKQSYGEVIIVTFIFQFIARAILRGIYQNTLIHCSRQNHDRFHRNIETRKAQVAAAETIDSTESALKQENEKETNTVARRIYVPVQEDLTGVYGAFTYSWRCLFMSFDYQDWVDPIVYYGFYVENALIIGLSHVVIHVIEYDFSDKTAYYVYTVAAAVGMVIAILIKYILVKALYRRFNKKLLQKLEKF